MKSSFAHWRILMVLPVLSSMLLSACGDGNSETNVASASAANNVTIVKTPMASEPLPASVTLTQPTSSAVLVTGDPNNALPNSQTTRSEFNPADFPDACNDYIDEVLQCIKVMDESGMEGTASMQMQLDEMQASWLKETDQKQLNSTCKMALLDIEAILHDLGC